MKILKLPVLMLLAATMIFTSCSNDDDIVDETPVAENPDPDPTPDPDPDPDPDPTSTDLNVAINEVSFQGTDWVEIANLGTETADISDYWLCLGPGTYEQLENLQALAGNTVIPAGEFVVVAYDLPDSDGGLGLYNSSDNFGDASTLVDFVQYGAGGSARENVAVEAGIWTAGDFVPTVRLSSFSIGYDGEGDASSDWFEVVNPTVGADNNTPIVTTTFNVTITNSINYLGLQLYNEPQNLSSTRSNPTRASLDSPGEYFEIDFVASPGANMSFVSMSSISNDWLFAPDGEGISIFDENGDPIIGNITDQIYLWDAGTEEENPATFGGAGENERLDDDDNTVRVLETDVSDYLNAELTNYDAATRTFTLRITNLRGEFADPDPIRISPGIVALHAQDDPFFTEGAPDRGVGLQLIAERGNIADLWEWFNEEGTDGAPVRIASSWSTISPGIVYAFNTETDPWFTQGEAMAAGSGLEELAEAGVNTVASDYIGAFGIPVAVSEQTRNLDPGESLTFTIEVPQGQNYKLGIGTMLVRTNDWFMSFNNNGVALFDDNGTPFSGTSESDEIYLFDAGTEEDELVGIGDFLGTPPGPEDNDTTIRRVMSIDDQQFGKGIISSAPGTAWIGDPRGGYNLLEVDIQPQ